MTQVMTCEISISQVLPVGLVDMQAFISSVIQMGKDSRSVLCVQANPALSMFIAVCAFDDINVPPFWQKCDKSHIIADSQHGAAII